MGTRWNASLPDLMKAARSSSWRRDATRTRSRGRLRYGGRWSKRDTPRPRFIDFADENPKNALFTPRRGLGNPEKGVN